MKAFLDELKRRNVIRVGGIYLVAGWILMQAAALLEDALSMPAWFDTIIVSLILLGFPVVLLFAWLYEVTPEGLRRTPAVDTPEGQAFAASTRRRLDRALIAGIVLAVGVIAADRLVPSDTAPSSAAATSAASQATAPSETQRIAFFGFTANGNDPAATEIAETATTEVFQALSAQQVEMAARADTVGAQQKSRIDRAAELGARFALSGEVRPETGSGRVSVTMRLEDVTARAALWEETFADDASPPLPVAVRAATRASGVGSCVVRYFSRLSRSSADKALLATIAAFCPDALLSTARPETLRAVRKLAQLAPKDGDFQGTYAVTLTGALSAATPSARPGQLAEAKQALVQAMALEPNGFWVAVVRFRLGLIERQPLAEVEKILTTSLQRAAEGSWEAVSHSHADRAYGNLLLLVGRTRAALPYFRVATEANPLSDGTRTDYVRALAFANRPEAEDRLQQAFARQPVEGDARFLLGAAVLLGAGDADKLLASPPKGVDVEVVQCWRDIHTAIRSGSQAARSKGVTKAKECREAGNLSNSFTIQALARLDDLGGAFDVVSTQPQPDTGVLPSFYVLFAPPTRAMRADQRFLPLVEKLGMMDYWRTTNTQPDVCEIEDPPFCRELKAAAKP